MRSHRSVACLLVFAALSMCACSSDSPTVTDAQLQQTALPAGVEMRATAAFVDDAQEPRVSVNVDLTNVSSKPVRVWFLAQAPIFMRLYEDASQEHALVFDQGNQGGTRLPGVLDIPAKGTRTLTRVVALDELEAAGLRGGRYRVSAVMTTTDFATVSAGTIDIP